MWFNLPAVSGDKDAVENRDKAAAKMTLAQVAEAGTRVEAISSPTALDHSVALALREQLRSAMLIAIPRALSASAPSPAAPRSVLPRVDVRDRLRAPGRREAAW
jgi:hypothetical protein